MPSFLIDVNLPYRFSLWNGDEFIHQYELGDTASDGEIWEYARQNNLTIVTKDGDFSNRIMFQHPPPKVVHIRVGNLKLRDLFFMLKSVWPEVVALNDGHKLVNVFRDRIEAIE